MTRKGNSTEIISVSLPQSAAREVDELVRTMDYPSRSELVREAVRGLIRSHRELDGRHGTIDGVMILLYDHRASREVSDIRHANMHLVKSFMHTDFSEHTCPVHEDACRCCEVMMFSGDAVEVRRLHEAFRRTKHVEESMIFLA